MSHTDSATEFSDDCDLCKLLPCEGSQKLQQNFYSKPNRKQKSRGCSFNRFMNMLHSSIFIKITKIEHGALVLKKTPKT